MQDTNGVAPTRRELDRRNDHDRGMLYMLPGVIVIAPLAYFVFSSIWTGKDQFGPLRSFLDAYQLIVLIVMIPSVVSMGYALYLVVIKDVMDIWAQERTDALLRKFAPMYRPRMTIGHHIAVWGFIIASFGMFALIVWLHFFR